MARRSPLRIALLNDHALVVEGLEAMLQPHAASVVVVDVSVDAPLQAEVDIVLYDTFGTDIAEAHWSHYVGDGWVPRFVVLYSWERSADRPLGTSEGAPRAIELSKRLDGEALVAALEQIDATGAYDEGEDAYVDLDGVPETARTWPGKAEGLTERESEIVFLIVEGLSNHELAERLFLGINTIKTYIRSAYRRMGVTSRSNAVLWGIDHGFRQHRPPS